MSNLPVKIRDDILYSIHRYSLDINSCVLSIEYSDIESVYTAISNLLMANVLAKLDPINTISKEHLYQYQKDNKDINIVSYYVNLEEGNDTLLILNNKIQNSQFHFQIVIYSINEKYPKEIKKYFEHLQYKDYKFEINKKEDNEKEVTITSIDLQKEKMHFISELLLDANTDYLKVYQLLAIEAGKLDILGKHTGSENINLLSSDARLAIFSDKLAKALISLNNASLPKIPIITMNKKIIVLGDYEKLKYIPSMIIIDPYDNVIHYTILGDPDDIKEIAPVVKDVLSSYPSALDNRYKHLKG